MIAERSPKEKRQDISAQDEIKRFCDNTDSVSPRSQITIWMLRKLCNR